MTKVERVLEAHEHCNCIVERYQGNGVDVVGRVIKDGCELQIGGLQLAVDCDLCIAFEEEVCPDLAILRLANDEHRWVIIESKTSLRIKAVSQINSCLNIFDKRSHYFDIQDDTIIEVVFAQIKKLRVADIQKYRKRSFEFRGQKIMPRVVQCGRGEII